MVEQLKYERPKSLVESVTARLREEIVEGNFRFGEALSESMIANRYNISRTPVREAFASLGLEGLVRTEPQQGTFVFTIDREHFAQMSETRSILEVAALKLSFERNEKALVKTWTRLVSAMETSAANGNGKRYCRYDGDFHHTLFHLSGNVYLFKASHSFSAKMATVRNRLGADPEHMKKSYKEHADLLRLVEKGDIAAAAEMLNNHIRFKGERFWAVANMITHTARSGPEPDRARGGRSRGKRSVYS